MARGFFDKYDVVSMVMILLVIIGGIILFMNIKTTSSGGNQMVGVSNDCPLSLSGRYCRVNNPNQHIFIDECTSNSFYFNNSKFNIVSYMPINKKLVATDYSYGTLEITDVSSRSRSLIHISFNSANLGVFQRC